MDDNFGAQICFDTNTGKRVICKEVKEKVIVTADDNLYDYVMSLGGYEYIIESNGSITVQPITEDVKVTSDITSDSPATNELNTNTADTLLSKMGENNQNTNSLLKQKNELAKNKNDILVESNRIASENVNAIKEQTQSLNAMVSVLVENGKQNLKNNSLVDMHNDFATNTNAMISYKLDFELYGKDDILNSENEKIIPLHEKAKKDSEKAIETKHMNAFGIEEATFISDAVENAFEASDLSNFNPFEALLTIVKEDTESKINLAKQNGGT